MESDFGLSNCSLVSVQHVHWLQSQNRPLSHTWHVVFAITGLCVFLGAVAGHILVLLLFVRYRSLRSFSNLFVLNLTVADFLLCVGNIPIFIIASFSGYWVFDAICCKVYAFIGSVTSFVSINTLAAISVDRCLVIVKTLPSKNRTSQRYAFIYIAIIWCYSASWAVAPLVGWSKFILEGTNTSCTFDFLTRDLNTRSYVTGIFTAHFIVPVSVICCSYFLIFKSITSHQRQLFLAMRVYGEEEIPLSVRNSRMNAGMKNAIKTAKVSAIVILVFCISWFPYATVALIGEFGDKTLVTRLASGIPCLCAKFSTIINPLMYALVHPKYREKLFNTMLCEDSRMQDKSSWRRRSEQLQLTCLPKLSLTRKPTTSTQRNCESDSV